jgi:oligopeptide/dipeptide ABC transporter ATP-binding protein
MRVGDIVAEPLRVHKVVTGAELRQRVETSLTSAGLTPVEAYLRRYPFELSGGQRQRVVIAAGLALEPTLLIADEPVSMLDVSIRADILNLLSALAREKGIAVVMITHDLSTVAAYADRIAVMYLGRIVEHGPTREVLANPQHPYAQALLSVVPVPDPSRRRRPVILGGETPDPSRIPSGCRFHPRCPLAFDRCPTVDPPLFVVNANHQAACLLLDPAAVHEPRVPLGVAQPPT